MEGKGSSVKPIRLRWVSVASLQCAAASVLSWLLLTSSTHPFMVLIHLQEGLPGLSAPPRTLKSTQNQTHPETTPDPSRPAVCQPRVLSPSLSTPRLHQTLVITHLTHSWRGTNISPHLLIFLRDFQARALSPSEGLLEDTIPNSVSNDSSPGEEE